MYLNETRCWPVLKVGLALLVCMALALGALALLARARGGLTAALPEGGLPTSSPEAFPSAAQASPTLHAQTAQTLDTASPQTVLLSPSAQAAALCDPFAYNGLLLFAAGEDAAQPTRLLRVDPASGEATEIPAVREHDALRNPCEDEAYLVYLDAAAGGGGTVRAIRQSTGETFAVCTLASGVAKLYLDSPYLAFTERISAEASRLCVWNLDTGVSVALAVFTDPFYASSAPCLADGTIYFADQGDGGTSVIRAISLADGGETVLQPGALAHDPRILDQTLAYLTAPFGADGALCWFSPAGEPVRVARGAVDFGLLPGCLAYCRDETIYAVSLEDGRTHVLSAAGTRAQLAFAGGGVLLWRDLTDPDAPLWKFVRLG